MLRRSSRPPRGSRRIVLAVIGCVAAMAALIVFVKSRTTNTHSELETKARAVTAAAEERQNQQRAAADQARAALPADAPVPREWTLAACLQALDANAMSPGLDAVLQIARTLLSNEDLTNDAPSSGRGGKQGTLDGIKNRIDIARQAGVMTPLEDTLDLSHHSREEVLSGIDRYLCGLAPIQEAEVAYEKGLFIAQETPRDKRQNGVSDYTVAEVLAYRAVFDARRGETDKALKTYLNALGMQRQILQARNGFATTDLWFLQRTADFAWTRTPFAQEQRDQILTRIGTAATPERLMEIMYGSVELERKNRDRAIADMRKEPLGFIGEFFVNYHWNRWSSQGSACMQELPALFAQPASLAIPAMERLATQYPSGPAYYQIGARTLTVRAARLHAQNALAGSTPDIIRTAFALKDYKRAHAEYPKTLDGVTPDPIPALPLDPFTGQPLVYQSDGKTFTIALPQTSLDANASKFRKDLSSMMATRAQLWLALE